MPSATSTVQKRVLADTTNARANLGVSPTSAKKRKLNAFQTPKPFNSSQSGSKGKLGSSQVKSHFEEEVLEKLTQDIHGLRKNNSEKDQQWDRPPLTDFDPATDSLCFQQIEVEEGTLFGGRTTVKLFGVTEVGV
jgi:DNA polymerase delta subunit 1